MAADRRSGEAEVDAAPGGSDARPTSDTNPHRLRDAALLALLVATVTAVDLLWLSLDARPPHWDRARHLLNSVDLYDQFSLARPVEWSLLYTYYPPFLYWITDVFYAVLGRRDIWVAALGQTAFITVLVYATYGIGARTFSGRVGFLSAIFVVTSPLVISAAKDYMLDLPLTAMTALALYALVRTNAFASRRWSALFGLICGLGLLTKWSFVLALWLVGLLALFAAARAARLERSLARAANVAIAGVIVLVIAAPWYIRNFTDLMRDTYRYDTVAAQVKGDPPVMSPQSLLYYAWNLLDDQLFLVPFLLFVVGLVLLARRADVRERAAYPLLLFVGTYLAFSVLSTKDVRYTMPFLPGVAVIATYWLAELRPTLRRVTTAVLAAYCALTYFANSFGSPALPGDITLTLPGAPVVSTLTNFDPSGAQVPIRGVRIWAELNYPLGTPSAERWYQEEIFAEAAARGTNASLWYQGPDEDLIWFNTWGMAYYSARYKVPWVGSLDQASFAAIRTPASHAPTPPPGFVLVREYAQPDGATLSLYQRF